jgi:hypothetical protein
MNAFVKLFAFKALFALGFLFAQCAAHSQIPVTDGLHIGMAQGQWIKQLAEMTTHLAMLRNQWNTAQSTLASLSNSRNIGKALLNNPAVLAQFPPGTAENIRKIQAGGLQGASTAAKVIYNEMMKVPCKGSASLIAGCQATGLLSVTLAQSVDNALLLATQRAQQLQLLVVQADQAADAKDAADLQSRIQAMQVQVQADTQVVTLAIKLQETQIALASKRQAQADAKEFNTIKDKCYVCTN